MPITFQQAWDKIQPIRGWFSNKEQARKMWDALQGGGSAIELGSYCGRSAVFMAMACITAGKGGVVYAVDTFEASSTELDGKSTFEEFEQNLIRYQVADHVVVFRGISQDPEVIAAVPTDAAVLYIDANHDFDMVAADIRNWRKHVRKGGMLMMHDYYTDGSNQFPGVKTAADEASSKKLLHNPHVIHGDSIYFIRPNCSCKGW